MTNRNIKRDRSAHMTNRSVHKRNRSAQMNRCVHLSNSTPHRHRVKVCQMQSSKFCTLPGPPARLRSSGMFLLIPLQGLRPIHLEPFVILSFCLLERLLRLNFSITSLCMFSSCPGMLHVPHKIIILSLQ